MKKFIFSLVVFIGISTSLTSQTFSDTYQDSITYLTPREAAFMMDKETKFLLKTFLQKNTPGDLVHDQLLAVSFEKKLSKAFSVSLLSSIPIEFEYFDVGEDRFTLSEFYWKGGLEFRYYHQLPKLIKAKKQANNLSGNYLGATFETNLYGYNYNFNNITKSYFYHLTYGIQKRFLNTGFIDFTINLGSVRYFTGRNIFTGPPEKASANNYGLSLGIKAGLALGKNYRLAEGATCPIFKCFKDRNTAFKINLIKNWALGWQENLSFNMPGQWYMILNPNISYELKLAKSPLSFNQDFELEIQFRSHRIGEENSFGVSSYALNYRAGFRYYHNMMNRIKKGKSGNNLSGYYSFLRGQYEQYTFFGWFGPKTNWRPEVKKRVAAQLGLGYQKAVLKRMYFDVNIGVSQYIEQNSELRLRNLRLISEVKVGLMF